MRTYELILREADTYSNMTDARSSSRLLYLHKTELFLRNNHLGLGKIMAKKDSFQNSFFLPQLVVL